MTARSKWWLLAIGVTVAAGCTAVWLIWGRQFTVVISQAELQQRLAAKFPISKTHLRIFKATYSHPIVILDEGSDRIRAGVDVEVDLINDRKLTGTGVISGRLIYAQADGEFLLADARMDSMDIHGMPERYAHEALQVASLATKQYLDRKPLYRLKQSDLKQSLAKLVLRRVEVHEGQVIVTMAIGH